uniref:Uncharacterized protein n=1 Tax=Hyaloperonospora arabidopsidis (strain Emoy2) TaxID=559515 RepID=M4BV08_HYAAE
MVPTSLNMQKSLRADTLLSYTTSLDARVGTQWWSCHLLVSVGGFRTDSSCDLLLLPRIQQTCATKSSSCSSYTSERPRTRRRVRSTTGHRLVCSGVRSVACCLTRRPVVLLLCNV